MLYRVLLVDDHSMITNFYETAIKHSEIDTKITIKNTLESAYQFIFSQLIQPIDVIFLDLSMPPYTEKKINNGEDLAKLIRVKYPKIKIIILSSLFRIIQLERIIQNISPEGLVEKIDISNSDYISNMLNAVINGEYIKSEMVKKTINSNSNKIYLDSTNRQIIILLSQGVKTKNISKYLPINESAVHKRKLKIKKLLEIDFGNDEDILRESKLRGLI